MTQEHNKNICIVLWKDVIDMGVRTSIRVMRVATYQSAQGAHTASKRKYHGG